MGPGQKQIKKINEWKVLIREERNGCFVRSIKTGLKRKIWSIYCGFEGKTE